MCENCLQFKCVYAGIFELKFFFAAEVIRSCWKLLDWPTVRRRPL